MVLAVELISGVSRVSPSTQPDSAPAPAVSAAPAGLVVGDHRTVELINLGGPETGALLDRIAAAIGPAVEAVEAFWGTDWSHRLTVTATGTDQQFAILASRDTAGDPAQWSDIAAVAVADGVDRQRRVVSGQQVVFAPGAVGMTAAALRIVLTHELFHYAARLDTAVDAPRWLTEGVADFVARPVTPGDSPPLPMWLPSDADLTATGPRRAQAYERSWWFARYVGQRYGADGLRRLYLAACGPDRPDLAATVHRVLGSPLPDVLADWQHWAQDFRNPPG